MKVVFVVSAQKELSKLEKSLAQRIIDKIEKLGDDPYGQNSVKLAGGKGYRIRLGDYRVVYTINLVEKVITIIKIAHRRDVYRKQ